MAASGVPVHLAVPMPPMNPGEAVVARAFQREHELAPWPAGELAQSEGQGSSDQAADFQRPRLSVDDRPVVVIDGEELIVRRHPGVELFPPQQIADRVRRRVVGRLIQPGDDFLALPARKRLGKNRGMKKRQPGERGSTLNHEIPA
jgi:hypothetical protein